MGRTIDLVKGEPVIFLGAGVAVFRDGMGMYRVQLPDEPHDLRVYYHAGVGFINLQDKNPNTAMRMLLPGGLGSNTKDDIVSAMLELEILSQINSDKAQVGMKPPGW